MTKAIPNKSMCDIWIPKQRVGLVKQGKSEGFDSCGRPGNLIQIGFKLSTFQVVRLWASKNDRAPFLYYTKLCASFQIHRRIQTRVTVRKRSIRVKISDFFVPCDLEIWQMTLKTIGHLFYVASNSVHNFIAISEFKLKWWSGNAQFGSKSVIFVLCDLEFWQMTLKNNRVPLVYYTKLCA